MKGKKKKKGKKRQQKQKQTGDKPNPGWPTYSGHVSSSHAEYRGHNEPYSDKFKHMKKLEGLIRGIMKQQGP